MPKPKIVINAPFMMIFAFFCGASYLLHVYTNGALTDRLFSVYRSTEMDLWWCFRFVFHVCGYSNPAVLFEDLFLILAIGPMLEEKYDFKVVLLVGAIAIVSSVFHFLMFPGVSLAGAKGVITGLLVMGSFTGAKDGSIPITFIIMLFVLIGQQVYRGFYGSGDAVTNAYVAESIVGGVIGAGFTCMK